jgi:hypothetical protein
MTPLLSPLTVRALPLLVLLCTGCCWLGRQPDTSLVMAVMPSEISPTDRLGLEAALRDYLARVGASATNGPTIQIVNAQSVLAWAAKIQLKQCPPNLVQEALLLFDWCDRAGSRHVSLAVCSSWGGEWIHRTWEIHSTGNLAACEDRESRPSADQIADFIRRSNFGFNEYTPREVVGVLSVRSSTTNSSVLRALRGISQEEKLRRLDDFINTGRHSPR